MSVATARLLPGDMTQAVADQMDDTQLDLGFRIDRCYGLGKAFKFITAGNQDVLQTIVLQVR
jgi:hypothetical protein